MEEASREWSRRFGLASDQAQEERFAAIGVGELGGRVTARSVDVEHAQFAADSVLWVCAFDDVCDEGAYSQDPGRMALLAAELLHAADTGRVR
ncbi:hypothetical protein ACFQ07_20505, partial [Actinomadura adrarensis]